MRLGVASLLLFVSCGNTGGKNPPPTCDATCQDKVVTRGVREMMKLAYNLTLQGKPVGDHDKGGPCPLGGTFRVVGRATSNAVQGSTEVDLTYEFATCEHLEKDTTPEENYRLRLTGRVLQKGTLAVQPSSTTALVLQSEGLEFGGEVFDPPVRVSPATCAFALSQSGNKLTGTLCTRPVGVDL